MDNKSFSKRKRNIVLFSAVTDTKYIFGDLAASILNELSDLPCLVSHIFVYLYIVSKNFGFFSHLKNLL